MVMIRFIGDVHGKFRRYRDLIRDVQNSIQVGDFGVGFRKTYEHPASAAPHDSMSRGNHRFIRGNHDNPGVCRGHKFWIPDGSVEGDMMFCGGALSIDRSMRTTGLDWWEDEELSYAQFQEVIDTFVTQKPRIMVTHDCPEVVATEMFRGHYKFNDPSITRQAFDMMFQEHQPEVWLFGHWHDRRDWKINGTRFICLEELGTIDLEV